MFLLWFIILANLPCFGRQKWAVSKKHLSLRASTQLLGIATRGDWLLFLTAEMTKWSKKSFSILNFQTARWAMKLLPLKMNRNNFNGNEPNPVVLNNEVCSLLHSKSPGLAFWPSQCQVTTALLSNHPCSFYITLEAPYSYHALQQQNQQEVDLLHPADFPFLKVSIRSGHTITASNI